jgi:hypothetical protein
MATLEFKMVPSGMPHRSPDMSPGDMRLTAASYEAAGSELPEPLAKGLCVQIIC